MKIKELSNSQISDLIDEWIRGERNRKLLKRRLIDEICYEPLAEEFDLSAAQIKNIIYKEQDKIFKKKATSYNLSGIINEQKSMHDKYKH